ncbi:NAD-dependent epimerase/dehydratase family protein [Humitalea sp. 24SJ18S-53]|uniref:NAD-dependent epimerase/dehydratase family protein n=1 Tax=Humitalea sp. 24SJ18S-53 TaxID=3422307 RepID=UPI003D67D458
MAKVLITGGAGFVGLNVTEALLARGDSVVIYGREPLPVPAAAAFAALPGQLTVILGDVLDDTALRAAFAAQPIDTVLPFAAITAGPAREAENPELVLDVNLKGLVATLKAARDAGGVRRVVLPSSSAVYGESAYAYPVLTEAETPCVPISLYGVTKYAVERMGMRLSGLWGLDAIAARIGATFGPWERDTGLRDTLSPHLAIAQAALAGRAIVIPAAPLPAYDWIYVRDLAAGLLALVDTDTPGPRVFNLASGLDWAPLAGACCDVMAARFPGFSWRHAAAGEAATVSFNETRPRGVMANTRAAGLGWAPRFIGPAAYEDYAAWITTRADAV